MIERSINIRPDVQYVLVVKVLVECFQPVTLQRCGSGKVLLV